MSIKSFFKSRSSGRRFLLVMLALMGVIPFLGTDVYLPALPAMGVAMHRSAHAMQITLGIYLLGLSIGQLILGPLSDCYGRRRVLLFGMLLFSVASLSCALSLSYTQLVVSRLLQALGAGSGLVIGRAIIRDLYDGKEAGRVFATIFPFMGASPAIAPLIGGLLSHYFGWRSTFWFVTFFALSVLVLIVCFLQESLSSEKRKKWHFRDIIFTYPKVMKNKQFLFYAAAPCTSYLAFFAYISQSPFIFQAHGFSEEAIGFFYINLSTTYILGNLLGRHLLRSYDLDDVLRKGYFLFSGGALLLFLSGFVPFSLWLMMGATSLLTFGNGFLMPLGTSGVVSSFTKNVGYASGLLGFLQLGVAAFSSAIIGVVSHNSVARMGAYILGVAVLGCLVHWRLFPKNQQPGSLSK